MLDHPIFIAGCIAVMACGLGLLLAGNRARAALPIELRSHVGLGRISIGIVAMATPMLYAIAAMVWAILSAYGSMGTV